MVESKIIRKIVRSLSTKIRKIKGLISSETIKPNASNKIEQILENKSKSQ